MQRPQTEAQHLFMNTKQITPPKIPKTPKINWDIFCSEFTHNLSAKKLEKHWKVQMPGKRREESGERGGGQWQWHLRTLSVWPGLDPDSRCCTPATNFSFYNFFLQTVVWSVLPSVGAGLCQNCKSKMLHEEPSLMAAIKKNIQNLLFLLRVYFSRNCAYYSCSIIFLVVFKNTVSVTPQTNIPTCWLQIQILSCVKKWYLRESQLEQQYLFCQWMLRIGPVLIKCHEDSALQRTSLIRATFDQDILGKV